MERAPRTLAPDDLHPAYVERTVRELQRVLQEEEGVLAELRRVVGAGPAPSSAAASLAAMTAGYGAAARAEPFVPFPDSVLPALLAMRAAHRVAAESQAYGAAAGTGAALLADARAQLAAETARRDDERALQAALAARRADLRASAAARRGQTAAERRQAQLGALRAQQRTYDGDTAALLQALRRFIHDRLGPMLAAEELGGPVVGGLVDVRPDDLAAGVRGHGKKRPRPRANDDQRQRRIDEIWGDKTGDGGEEEAADEADETDEAAAAAAEMQELTEQLLNALASAGGDTAAAYVTLARESAAARFLVRSKVAQFHPRDATRLRLIDFGRDLDD